MDMFFQGQRVESSNSQATQKNGASFFGFFVAQNWFRYQNLIHESFASFGGVLIKPLKILWKEANRIYIIGPLKKERII